MGKKEIEAIEKEEIIDNVELSFKDMGVKVDIKLGEKIKLIKTDLTVEGEIEEIIIGKLEDDEVEET